MKIDHALELEISNGMFKGNQANINSEKSVLIQILDIKSIRINNTVF